MSAARLLELYQCVFGFHGISTSKARFLTEADKTLIELLYVHDVTTPGIKRNWLFAQLVCAEAIDTLVKHKSIPCGMCFTGSQLNIRFESRHSTAAVAQQPVVSVCVLGETFTRGTINCIGKFLQDRRGTDWASIPLAERLEVGDGILSLLFGRFVGPRGRGFKIQQKQLTALLYELYNTAGAEHKVSFGWVIRSLWETDETRFGLGCDPGWFVFIILFAFIFNWFSWFFFCRLQAKQHC
jgi:hypothetical protein